MAFETLLSQYAALAGVGALIAFLVNALKAAGLVRDGQAITWTTGLNLVGLVALAALGILRPGTDLARLDATAALLAHIGELALGLVVQLGASRATHALARGVPVIGKSFTHG